MNGNPLQLYDICEDVECILFVVPVFTGALPKYRGKKQQGTREEQFRGGELITAGTVLGKSGLNNSKIIGNKFEIGSSLSSLSK